MNYLKKLSLVIILSSVLFLTGCLKRDTMEDITIYTTVYPIEYITTRLYGEHSTIKSIYPSGINILEYELSEKQISDYSEGDLFIFNGLSDEKNYVTEMFEHNKGLKIINTTESMEYNYDIEEVWLDPANFLMLAQNVKNGFNEYITNTYLKNEIEENYEQLKIEVSSLDAELKLMVQDANNKTIIATSDLFKYLEKYGFTVISLEENENLTDKMIHDAKTLIANNNVSYIFTTPAVEINETVQSIIDEYGVSTLEFSTIDNLTEDQRSANNDYISIMNENIELLKLELYQ